jgi:hypothetical protein
LRDKSEFQPLRIKREIGFSSRQPIRMHLSSHLSDLKADCQYGEAEVSRCLFAQVSSFEQIRATETSISQIVSLASKTKTQVFRGLFGATTEIPAHTHRHYA